MAITPKEVKILAAVLVFTLGMPFVYFLNGRYWERLKQMADRLGIACPMPMDQRRAEKPILKKYREKYGSDKLYNRYVWSLRRIAIVVYLMMGFFVWLFRDDIWK